MNVFPKGPVPRVILGLALLVATNRLGNAMGSQTIALLVATNRAMPAQVAWQHLETRLLV